MCILACSNWEVLNLNGRSPWRGWSCFHSSESLRSQREPLCQSPGTQLSPVGHQQLLAAATQLPSLGSCGHGTNAELLSKGRHWGWESEMGADTQSLLGT